MNSFGDRLAAQRAAAAAAQDAETVRLAELARAETEAKAAMRRLTAEFAERADAIGLHPQPVVTLRRGKHRVRTGLFSSQERGAVLYEETLGEGWVVTDHDPLRRSEYGEPYTQFVVLRDGRWINCVTSGASRVAFETPEAAKKNNYRFGESRPQEVHGLPPGFPYKGAIGFIITSEVPWVRHLHSLHDTEALLIEELLRAEARQGK